MKIFKIPLVIVWIFILINSKTIAQNGLSDNEIFKGRIMSVVEVYEEKSNGSEKNPSMKSEMVFNVSLQLIKKLSGDLGYTYLYDEAGKRIAAVVLKANDSIGYITYKYNASNKIIEEKNTNGQLITYVYDTLNYTIKTANFGKGGKLISTTIQIYDEQNWCIEKKQYIASGFSERLAEHNKYEYDEAGNCFEIFQELCDATFYKTSFKITKKYNLKGQWLEVERLNENDQFVSKETATYDEMGNMISFSRLNKLGEVTELNTYEFKYDETGNWIQKNSFREGGLLIVQKREIIYYL